MISVIHLCLRSLSESGKAYNQAIKQHRDPAMYRIRPIESRHNPRLKELRSALLKPVSKSGGRGDLAALEGFHLVEEAFASGIAVRTIFVAAGRETVLDALNVPASVEIFSVPEAILAATVTTESPQPIAALAALPVWRWPELLRGVSPLLIVLSGLQDPGNLGTILRSAEAFGATGAILLPGTVSPWNPKVMRASAGSVFRLPTLATSADTCFARLASASVSAVAAVPHDDETLPASNLFSGPLALVIGSEGAGIPVEILARCAHRVTIPCPGPVESLNAAVAASILMYEASRARRRG
jgi:TrmH family RNA methyltransferase